MKKKRYFSRTVIVLLAILFAFLFVMPTLLTITNSFMTQSEITANYGQVFDNAKDGKSYISKTINLKFIPDKVSFSQYWTVLLKSPDYIYKLWNSIILTVPIVFAQLMVASIAAYGFTRWRGKVRDSDAHALSGHARAELSGLRLARHPAHQVGHPAARRVRAVLSISAHEVHAAHPGVAH